MELQQLRYLTEVAKSRSFTRAAEECHVTQPTLSHQIKKLEEEVGEPLFQRRKKGAFLTPLGERIFGGTDRGDERESASKEADRPCRCSSGLCDAGEEHEPYGASDRRGCGSISFLILFDS